MNREIKFRAWDKTRKEYLSAGNIFISINTGRSPKDSQFFLDIISSPDMYKERFVIEQCTELKDKNRKEIYEGDILKVYEFKTIVKFGLHEAYNGWYAETKEGLACELNKTFEAAEIIGNIYENPDLLKEVSQ